MMFYRNSIIIAILLAVLSVLLLLSGCREQKDQDDASASETEQTEKKTTKKNKKTGKRGDTPATGTDLLVFEPWSENAEAALSHIYGELRSTGDFCAAAFLGYVSPSDSLPESICASDVLESETVLRRLPFVTEITPSHCCSRAFSEVYCLVPAESIVSLRVAEIETDEDGEPTGKELSTLLEQSDNGPILFSCSSSGRGGSNIRITMKDANGIEYTMIPGILSNLGTLSEADGVLDLGQ